MKKIEFYSFLILLGSVFFNSCNSNEAEYLKQYCGYALTKREFSNLEQKANKQRETIYQADSLYSIYDQVNDTLRNSIPDDIIFEIFLNTLDQDEFSISVYCPKNEKHLRTLACKFMNANFQGDLPKNRLLLMYIYHNEDGSGESPLEFALKKENN